MISGECKIRPRYNEVDQMGYVYHANYISYCHEARTELLREYGIHDRALEDIGIMMPVIDVRVRHLKPVGYDECIKVVTKLQEMPKTRFRFSFEFFNEKNQKVCKAETTLVFVDKENRKPMRVPSVIEKALEESFVINC
jgi:acyl-CoA thioester hydrolase